MNTSAERRQDFSAWLRTGRWPRRGGVRGLEFKFNPYHDPANGQFTTADGSGDAVGVTPATRMGQPGSKVAYVSDPDQAPIANMAEADAWRARELAEHGGDPEYAAAIEARYQTYTEAFSRSRANDSSLVNGTPSPDRISLTGDSVASNAPRGDGGGKDGDSVSDELVSQNGWGGGGFTGGGGGTSGGGGASSTEPLGDKSAKTAASVACRCSRRRSAITSLGSNDKPAPQRRVATAS